MGRSLQNYSDFPFSVLWTTLVGLMASTLFAGSPGCSPVLPLGKISALAMPSLSRTSVLCSPHSAVNYCCPMSLCADNPRVRLALPHQLCSTDSFPLVAMRVCCLCTLLECVPRGAVFFPTRLVQHLHWFLVYLLLRCRSSPGESLLRSLGPLSSNCFAKFSCFHSLLTFG